MMMQNELIKHLNALRKVAPSGAWQNTKKVALLAHLHASSRITPSAGMGFRDLFSFIYTFAPVRLTASAFMIGVLVLTSVLGGGVATSFAALSLPGDTLYPVKIAFEQANVWLASGEDNKARLQSENAERRLNEVEEVVRHQEVGHEQKVKEALSNFQKEVKGVTSRLDRVKKGVSSAANEVATPPP